ncbi:site-2 protease family protein [Paenibacillus apiarius]|uniref:Site-2 protease family protein n=1 Tax=Paenibacillus apiarius TaxID=46240 RepID=A0ABT4DRM7_9BACL|nr:site-2 protease family protein [Paenibacillus apiarius]MCY9515489.1 site-2 protease family protein [Paenibacillus apiarius]MCY9518898.1 site-2 protease family protein [Paenibacillus apiarius]MCY9552056.1 site-2 protease family protein [Paenibacillus apiarius]MCY9557268.1 site-2 protease family protein [Paenibacillus apiarius]MCY9682553.1 site-2 protease family protein [Paenibacillus apiarius]
MKQSIVPFLLGLIVSVAALLWMLESDNGIYIIEVLVLLFIAFPIAVLIHELGHAIGALLTRTKIIQFLWGPFILFVQRKNLKISWKNKYFFGAVIVDSSDYVQDADSFKMDCKRNFVIYIMGPIISIITGVIALEVGQSAEGISFMLLYGTFSLGIGIVTLLMSDGRKGIMMFQKNYALAYYWTLYFTVPDVKEDSFRFVLNESEDYLNYTFENNNRNIAEDVYDLHILYFAMYYCQVTRKKLGIQHEFVELMEKSLSDQTLPKQNREQVALILCYEVVNLRLQDKWEDAVSLLLLLEAADVDINPMMKQRMELFLGRSSDGGNSYIAQVQNEEVLRCYEEPFLKEWGLWKT